MDTVQYLQQTLHKSRHSIEAVLQLLSEGATIPFIARYRKQMTDNMDEETIRSIEQAYAYQENLKRRKESVMRFIEEKGMLTPEIRARIDEALRLSEVEDIYAPYKTKRKTRASTAIEAGLEPLARQIQNMNSKGSWESLLKPWIVRTGMNQDEILKNTGYIIAQSFSDNPDNRHRMKEWLQKNAFLTARLKKGAEDTHYEIYHDFSAPLSRLKPHQILAVNRAEKEKIITVSLEYSADAVHAMLRRNIPRGFTADLVEKSVTDGWKRLLLPSLTREIRRELTEAAESSAIETFQVNLEHLLMMRPLGACRVLGFDPGFRNGCKLAVLDEYGNVLTTAVIYPHASSQKQYTRSLQTLKQLIEKYKVKYIAIGNGTASRESEILVAETIRDMPDVRYSLVSEAGASVYSASDLAREEFPDLAIETRSAVSIGRRIQDPLSELVKIDPKSIGIGEYQHDVNQKQLAGALDFVTEKVVNAVGVNINTASPSILKYVSGLKKTSIHRLIAARTRKPFTSREQIHAVSGISDQTYELCIGFIRIPDAENPLDSTGIHPESYGIAHQILELLHLHLNDMRTADFRQRLAAADLDQLVRQTGADLYTVRDIVQELLHPGLDPRSALDGPLLKSDVLDIQDLYDGMELQGTVRNVTSFGAFVDIGLHQDGLIHISKMANHFIQDPKEIVAVGDIVTCYVIGTDAEKGRVSLSLIH